MYYQNKDPYELSVNWHLNAMHGKGIYKFRNGDLKEVNFEKGKVIKLNPSLKFIRKNNIL